MCVYQDAFSYWNNANAGISLSLGDTGIDCCYVDTDADCQLCNTDTGSTIYFHEVGEDDDPAETLPTTSGVCAVAFDVAFYSRGLPRDGEICYFDWVDRNVQDLDCSDGQRELPFYQTIVHESGHILGLDDVLDSPVFPCSVMNSSCECCSHEEIQDPDLSTLVSLYKECL
mgnify:FL=1|jgi:hypothetical protein